MIVISSTDVTAMTRRSSAAEQVGQTLFAQSGPELSVIVPTFNEYENVDRIVQELSDVLAEIDWEVIFVDDDSPDQTAQAVRRLGAVDRRVRCVQRIGRRGLSSACIEGILASSAPFVAVMDGDLQHDTRIIPRMLETLRGSEIEIVVGSRYTEGGSISGWDGSRALISRLATSLGRILVPRELKDPMSGFFMLRRPLFDEIVRDLSGVGFKILLDIFASAKRDVAFCEIPFEFRTRQFGSSKLDSLVAWEYGLLLADKLVGHHVPVRFVVFALIGGLGVGVHMAVLATFYRFGQMEFVVAQAVATVAAMIFNYSLNNILTYHDRRRRGLRWLTGLLSFMGACSVGALANVGVAAYLFNRESRWLMAALAGVLTGAVWNYAVTSAFTWGRSKR
jgi:dolichol-phosphate mannosyltransferase